MTAGRLKIPVSMLSPAVDPAQLGFDDTSELEPLNEIIGQEPTVEALEFGLHMKGPGFNLYVSVPVGTGKGTLVRQMGKRMAQGAPAGERGLDGEYAPDTVYCRAAQRLAELAQAIAEWSKGETKPDGRIITEL